MPKQNSDRLTQLILSLNKAEKRHFKIFVNRNQSPEKLLYLQLFDFIEKVGSFEESKLLTKIPEIKKRQLSNLKANLYKQLLISLRLLHSTKNLDIQLREKLDFARILYNKGLYNQSLILLVKSREKAIENRMFTLALEMLEQEKLIESQYITRSTSDKAQNISRDARDLVKKIPLIHKYSNLSIQLYALYLKVGHIRNLKDYHFVTEFFASNRPNYQEEELGFYEKLYLYQSYVWYSTMTQNFLQQYKFSQKWVNLFRGEPEMIAVDIPLYLKGIHNVLTSLFLAERLDKFVLEINFLQQFWNKNQGKLNKNEEGLYWMFLYLHQINRSYLDGSFSQAIQELPPLLELLKDNYYNWDPHRIMVFYYKIACLYFGAGDNENTILYLNQIINVVNPNFREDIQCFSRFLSLIAHYELGNDLLISYQIKSVYRFLLKMEDLQMVQKEILKFLRRTPGMHKNDLKKEFISLRKSFLKIQHSPFEKRPFLYLDVISWLEAKIEGTTTQEIRKRKFLAKQGKSIDIVSKQEY